MLFVCVFVWWCRACGYCPNVCVCVLLYVLPNPQVLSGPFVAMQYRLNGPASSPSAKPALMQLTRGHDMDEMFLLVVLNLYGSLLAPLGFPALASASTFI